MSGQLQGLLADIGAGRIDIVVVYKVDRLTRSLGGSPCLPRRNADGDHTHALVAPQSHSYPDNLVALLAGIRAWNCSAPNARSAVGVEMHS
jgi:hypothetical protein